MEKSKKKYVLLNDRVGYNLERNPSALGLSTKASPTQLLRGELLEALPKAEQPPDGNRIALVGIERKSLRLVCSTLDLNRLSDEEANLLLAISSLEERYVTVIDRKRLDFGRRLSPESQVFVSVKGFTKELPGVVWYKGELPSFHGTMFGVELIVGINSRVLQYNVCTNESAFVSRWLTTLKIYLEISGIRNCM